MQENFDTYYDINAQQEIQQPYVENENKNKKYENLDSKLSKLKKIIENAQKLYEAHQNTNSEIEYKELGLKMENEEKKINKHFEELKNTYYNEFENYVNNLREILRKSYFCNSLLELLNSDYDFKKINLEDKLYDIEQTSENYFMEYFNKNLEYLSLGPNEDGNNINAFRSLENKINRFKNLNFHNEKKEEIKETKDSLLILIKQKKNLNEKDSKYICGFLCENKILKKKELQDYLYDTKFVSKSEIKKRKENKIVLKNEIEEEIPKLNDYRKNEINKEKNKNFLDVLNEIEEDLPKLDDYSKNVDNAFKNYEKQEKKLKEKITKLEDKVMNLEKKVNYYKHYTAELENMIDKLKHDKKNIYKNISSKDNNSDYDKSIKTSNKSDKSRKSTFKKNK